MWKLFREEEGTWRETGETFAGTREEAEAYADQRRAEDGWSYRVEPA